MICTDYLCQHLKNVFICLVLISLCKSSETTKDELLAKIETCKTLIENIQAEKLAAINKGRTDQEKMDIANSYDAQFPSQCENVCDQIKAQVDKELAEAVKKLTNPQQSEIDKLKLEIEAQFPVKAEECGKPQGSDIQGGFPQGSFSNGGALPQVPEISKEALLAKIERCRPIIDRLEAEMLEKIAKARTEKEKMEIGLSFIDENSGDCKGGEICGQIIVQVQKELTEAKEKLNNPSQSEIDKLKKEIEAQFPVLAEHCQSDSDIDLFNIPGIKKIPRNAMEKYSDSLKTMDANSLIEQLKSKGKGDSKSFSISEMTALGEELVKKLGGAKGMSLTEVENMGPAIVTSILPGEYKYLSDDVFEYILKEIYTETSKAVNNEFGGDETVFQEYDGRAVSTGILANMSTARIKALCGRAFRQYRTTKQIKEGWNNIKYLMFCAPPNICKKVDNELIQEDINAFGFQPWVCKDAKLGGADHEKSKYEDYLVRTEHMIYQTKKLFPSNIPCGKILAKKAVTGGTSPFQFNSFEAVERMRYFITCLPDSVFKDAIDEAGCEFGGEMYKAGALSRKMTRYTTEKCLSTPPDPSQVTCDSLGATYRPYLREIKRSFFKSLPTAVMCDTKCMELFKSEEKFPKDVMKFITKTCFKDSTTITSDDVKNLGGLVTDLPLDKFEKINAADLETNIKSIKTDLKAGKKQGGRKAVVKKLAKKMLDDGKISNLIDSKEIMKEVSLKDLKSSLSQSDDIIQALGINDTQDSLGFTDSQKKWVVKQVVKKKEANSFTLEDIQGMKSLVTGLLSSHIKKIGEAHSQDTQGMTFAVEMCSYSDWPRKSLEAINKYLIQTSLEVRSSTDPMSTLTNTEVQSLGCQCLLNFNTSLYENMDKEVCSAVCMKIGYCDSFRCMNPIRRNNVLQACLKCKGLGSHTMTDTDFEELGPNLISQMSETQLELVPAEVLQTHIEFFKDICMDQVLRKALSEALLKVIGSSGSDYDMETLFLLGNAIKVLPKTLQQELDKSVIAEMQSELMDQLIPSTDEEKSLRDCCEKWLDTADLDNLKAQNFDLMLTIKDAFFADVVSKRRKRSMPFKWTCRLIRPLPILFKTASPKAIDMMDDKEFLDCLEIIGNIDSMHRWQHKLLFTKAQKALGQNVCSMTADQIEELGVIALALHVHDIRCLPLQDKQVVASLGSLKGWDENQLSALASRYMVVNNLTDLSNLTSEEVTMLGPILCGLPANQLITIQSKVFGESGKDIGSLKECKVNQLAAFVSLAVQYDAYSPINTWDADDISELKYVIAGLSGIEIKELTNNAIEGLHPEVIPRIPRYVLQNLRSAHFSLFSADQAAAVTKSQRTVLSEEQNFHLDRILGLKDLVIPKAYSSGAQKSGPMFECIFSWWLLQIFPFICVVVFKI